jgi:FkbM family methyltransferase
MRARAPYWQKYPPCCARPEHNFVYVHAAGNFLFEEAMLAATSCELHTFDCTYEGSSILPGRHFYYQWCIGNPGLGITTGLTFKSWDQVTRELNHDYVNLLKIDIEGHEYPVLAALQAGSQRVLPDEISIEIHARYVQGWASTHLEGSWQNGLNLPHTPGDMALVFMHLANQGYGVCSAEENFDWYMCCSEFSFLRIPAAVAATGQQHK